jgi:hypothetical protein
MPEPFAIKLLNAHETDRSSGFRIIPDRTNLPASMRKRSKQWPGRTHGRRVPDYSGGSATDSHRVPECRFLVSTVSRERYDTAAYGVKRLTSQTRTPTVPTVLSLPMSWTADGNL